MLWQIVEQTREANTAPAHLANRELFHIDGGMMPTGIVFSIICALHLNDCSRDQAGVRPMEQDEVATFARSHVRHVPECSYMRGKRTGRFKRFCGLSTIRRIAYLLGRHFVDALNPPRPCVNLNPLLC